MKFQNSESVFNVIGEYPVVDQFEVSYSAFFSGSTNDNYVTGSLVRKIKLLSGKTVYVTGSRSLAFSKIGVEQDSYPGNPGMKGRNGDEKQSYNLQPWRERSGFSYNSKVFSNVERFYDSLLPSISDLARSLNFNIEGIENKTIGAKGLKMPVSDANSDGFLKHFPFEPKLSSATRVLKATKGFKATSGVTGVVSENLLLDFDTDYVYALGRGATYNGNYPVSYSPNYNYSISPVNQAAKPSDVIKIIFGYGDYNNLSLAKADAEGPPSLTFYFLNGVDNTNGYHGYAHLPYFRSGSAGGGVTARVCSPIIRGWKYGLINGNPHYSSCVFRRNKYGQFRDMLEQRLYSSMVDDFSQSPCSFFGDFEDPATPFSQADSTFSSIVSPQLKRQSTPSKTFTQDPPIKVAFVRQTIFEETQNSSTIKELIYENELPKNTWSSNLSQYATSSLPFFDGESKNREPFTGTPSSKVITTVDNLGNISIGITT